MQFHGTNVAYVILATKLIFQKIIGKSISEYLSVITIILFVLVSGASPSVLRAGLMAIIMIFSSHFSKKSNIISSISVSALILLLINPFILFDIGFILSYGGTIGIVLLNSKLTNKINSKYSIIQDNKIIKSVFEILSVTLSAQIILFPIMWYYFNSISIISILSNLLIAPFVGFITIIGILIYIIGLFNIAFAKFIGYSLYSLVSIVIYIAKFCSSVPFSNVMVPSPSIIFIIIYYLAIYKHFKNKEDIKLCNKVSMLNILLLVLISLLITDEVLPKDYIEINFLYVQQGDSCHIKTEHGLNILIDGGGSEQSDYDIGENILVPYLLKNTNGKIDLMIISHFHEDHAEGCLTVLKKLKVGKVLIGTQPLKTTLYEEFLKITEEKSIPVYTLHANNSFSVDGLRFDILYPSKKLDIEDDLNNNSLVIKASYCKTNALFVGDAEFEEENAILDLYKDKLKTLDIDILKVGHHGSKTSSSKEFLNVITPKISVISCGINNKFKHPHEEAVKNLEMYTKNIFRTDQHGEISLKIKRNGKIFVTNDLLNP